MHRLRRIPPLALLALALATAACGSDDPEPAGTAAPVATPPPPAEEEHHVTFEPGHSKAVRRYYGAPHTHAAPQFEGLPTDSEADFHLPPDPAAGGIGDTITLTGTNLGIRMDVTVIGVEPSLRVRGERYAAVRVRLFNDGIANFESSFTNSAVIDAAGRRARVVTGVRAPCSNGLHDFVRIEVGRKRSGCLLYRTSARPERLLLALEQVPTNVGGRWSLR